MQLIQKDLLRTYTLEILPTKTGQLNFTFPDIPFLRNKISYAIDCSINSIMMTSGKENAFSTADFFQIYGGFITLVDSQNNQFVQNMPLCELMSLQNQFISANTGSQPLQRSYPYNSNGTMIFSERIVQWNKCSLFFPAPAISLSQGFQFTIYYK
jgi:hypothetical protein